VQRTGSAGAEEAAAALRVLPDGTVANLTELPVPVSADGRAELAALFGRASAARAVRSPMRDACVNTGRW
jgi:hypothetical protein